MPVGIADLKNVISLPGTWDLDYLRKYNNEVTTGVKFDELAQRIGAGILAFNESLVSPDSYWARYITLTTDASVEYDTGGSSSTLPQLAEHSWSDPVTSSGSGHMIPRKDFGGALGWTFLALRRAPMERLTRNLRAVIDQSRNVWEVQNINRLFSNTAETVGASGKSVPFADGGTADTNYIPVSYNGKTFDNTHSHFARNADSAAGRAKFLQDGATSLREHGISGPYDLVIPEVDTSDWTALVATDGATFIKPQRGEITMTNIAQRAAINEEVYIGVIEIDRAYFYVRTESRLSTNCAGIFKPLGLNTPGNPLLVRYEEGYPLGLSLVANIEHVPFVDAKVMFTFGSSINNRVSGYCGSFAAGGSYVAPTVS